MKHQEYMCLHIKDIPNENFDKYNLKTILDKDRSNNLEATKGMYGLPHARLIANELL